MLTYQILKAQTDPCVVVYVAPNSRYPTLLDIVIENIGRGLARDVRFEISEPIPQCVTNPKVRGKPIDSGPLIDGIPALPPGGKRSILWGIYPDIEQFVGGKRFVVICRYKRAYGNSLALESDLEQSECILEHRSFIDEGAYKSELAEAIEKLGEVASGMTAISRKLERWNDARN